MLFSLEDDRGDAVRGYCVPDAFSVTPRLRICDADRVLLVIEANEIREALVAAGRHETGRCGFHLDEKLLPGLRDLANLGIYDDETGLLIYRRRRPDMMERKIVRLETHLYPLWRFDEALRELFQYYGRGVDAYGRETVTQMFLLNKMNSIYLSGRLLYRNFASYIDAGFKVFCLVQDPHEELAERLLILSKIRKVGLQHLGPRDSMVFEPAAVFAESLDLTDARALKRAFRRAPESVARALSNPLTRQMTAATPDEMPGASAVAATLQALASFLVVGLRRQPHTLAVALGEHLRLDPESLPAPGQFPTVAPLAQILRETGCADLYLEKDIEVYHYLSGAMRLASEPAA